MAPLFQKFPNYVHVCTKHPRWECWEFKLHGSCTCSLKPLLGRWMGRTGLNNVCACAISHDNKAKFSVRTCERDLQFVSRFKKTHCQQQWSKGVLFLHSTSTVLAFASQTIIWIRTSWILIFWERNVGWNMNYDLLCLRVSSVATQGFSQVFVIK